MVEQPIVNKKSWDRNTPAFLRFGLLVKLGSAVQCGVMRCSNVAIVKYSNYYLSSF